MTTSSTRDFILLLVPEINFLIYTHFPAAWTAMLAFAALGFISLSAAFRKGPRPIVLLSAALWPALCFSLLALLSGMLSSLQARGLWWPPGDTRLIIFAAMAACESASIFLLGDIARCRNPAKERLSAFVLLAAVIVIPVTKLFIDALAARRGVTDSFAALADQALHKGMLLPLGILGVLFVMVCAGWIWWRARRIQLKP